MACTHKQLLLGTSLLALLAIAQAASAQDLVNPQGSTVGTGFIRVNPGDTFDNVFNFGRILGNGAAGEGIRVMGDVLGDVANRAGGLIGVTGATGAGMWVGGGASVGGDVENLGFIIVEATSAAFGIEVQDTDTFVGGDVANRGDGVMLVGASNVAVDRSTPSATATAARVDAHGIRVAGSVTGVDDIANFGVLRVGARASAEARASGPQAFAVAAAGPVTAIGMSISGGQIEGALLNAGLLEVDAVAHAAALAAASAPVAGDAEATWLLATGSLGAAAAGFEVDAAAVLGGVANLGRIDVAATAEMIEHAAADAAAGNAIAGAKLETTLTRRASASVSGVFVAAGDVGGVLNLGTIDAAAGALVEEVATAKAADGTAYAVMVAAGNISLTARAHAEGIDLKVADIGLGMLNTGTVSARADATVRVDLSASAGATAQAELLALGAVHLHGTASAYGIQLDGLVAIAGDLSNAGDIDAAATARLDLDLAAHAASGHASAYLLGFSALSITREAHAGGLGVEVGTIEGELANAGDVAATAVALVSMDASASGLEATAGLLSLGPQNVGVAASAEALRVSVGSAAAVGNAGDLAGRAGAALLLDIAADARTGQALAGIFASASQTLYAHATASGIRIDAGLVAGDVTNEGAVAAEASAVMDVSVRAGGGTHAVAGVGLGGEAGVRVGLSAFASAHGIAANLTTVAGDFANDGRVDTAAHAAVLIDLSAHADGAASAYLAASDLTVRATANAFGMDVAIGNATSGGLAGAFVNAGDVTVDAAALIDLALTASGGEAAALISAASRNLSLHDTAYARGVRAEIRLSGGDLENSGDIAASADAWFLLSLSADGADGALALVTAASSSVRLRADAKAIGLLGRAWGADDVSNIGDVDARAHALVDLDLAAHAETGTARASVTALNSLTLYADAYALGVYFDAHAADAVVNSGDATAAATGVVRIAARADTGAGKAAAAVEGQSMVHISAGVTAYGVALSATSADAMANSGDIDVLANAGVVIGLTAIAESGTASALLRASNGMHIGPSALAVGLWMGRYTVGGDLANSGDVAAAAAGTVDIALAADNDAGSALAYIQPGDTLPIDASARAYGLQVGLGGAGLGGDLVNSGALTALARAAVTMAFSADAIGGRAAASITLDGAPLQIRAHANAAGLRADIAAGFGGDLINSGDIRAAATGTIDLAMLATAQSGSAVARLDVRPHASTHDLEGLAIGASDVAATGIDVNLSTALAGSFANAGAVDAQVHDAAKVSLAADADGFAHAYLAASDAVTVLVSATVRGIALDAPAVGGDLENTGAIRAIMVSTAGATLEADARDGTAAAFVDAGETARFVANLFATGIALHVGTVAGAVENSGDILVLGAQDVTLDLDASATNGSASAYIAASWDFIEARGTAYGLRVVAGTIGDDLRNSGDVTVADLGHVDVGIAARAGQGTAHAYIGSTEQELAIRARARAEALRATATTLAGDLANTGDLLVVANAGLVVALTAAAAGNAYASLSAATANAVPTPGGVFSAVATAAGLAERIDRIAGDIRNSGAIDAHAAAAADIALKATASAAGEASAFIVANYFVKLLSGAKAQGLDLGGNDALEGDLENSGDIDIGALADLAVALSAYAGAVGPAFAHLSAGLTASIGAKAQATGILAVFGSVGGDAANSGAIDAGAGANVDLALSAEAEDGDAFAYVSQPERAVRIAATAYALGIVMAVPSSTMGAFSNTGDLALQAAATLHLGVSADAAGEGGSAFAYIAAATDRVVLTAHGAATGITIFADAISGAVDNSGAVDAAAVDVLDVVMAASATDGSAHAYLAAAGFLQLRANAVAAGLRVGGGAIEGDIHNSGDMAVHGRAALAIDIAADGRAGAEAYLSAFQAILLTASASARGLGIEAPIVGELVENSGDLDVSGIAQLDLTLRADASEGVAKAFLFDTRSILLQASAHATGIAVGGEAVGDINNSGAIGAAAAAALAIDMAAHGDGASAFLNATGTTPFSTIYQIVIQASAMAYGVRVSGDGVGDTTNSGALDVQAVATLGITLAATADTGDAVADIYADRSLSISAFARGTGLAVIGGAVGSVENSGDIAVLAQADLDLSLAAHAPNGSADAHISAAGSATFSAQAQAYGVEVAAAAIGGAVVNSGDITAAGAATLRMSFDADGTAFIDAETVYIAASAGAVGIAALTGAIDGDVTNSGDVLAVAHATASVTGLGGTPLAHVRAGAIAMVIASSGTVLGDVVNTGRLGALASAHRAGSAGGTAYAAAFGIALRMDVTGNVVNHGIIVVSAYASSAHADGIAVIRHNVDGSIQNTGIIAAFARGTVVEEAFAINAGLADGPTLVEQLDGFIIGDINFNNTADYGDTLEFSGGEIRGDLYGNGAGNGDALLAYQGADRALNLSGTIYDFATIDVNAQSADSSTAPVELRLVGDVVNSGSLNVNAHGTLVVGIDSAVGVETYNQSPSGTTLFEIMPAGLSGGIFPGQANLAGTVGIRPAPGLYDDQADYLVVSSTNPINGTYDDVRSTALLRVDAFYDIPNEVHLTVNRVAFDAVGRLTRNQGAVGGALEADYHDIDPNSDFADVVGGLFGLSADQYREALTDLAGAEHAQILKIGAGAIQSIDNALMGRLAFVRGLSAEQMASVDGVGMAFAQVASTGDVDLHMDLAQAEAQQVANPGDSGMWARVFGGTSTLDGDDEAPGVDTDNGGVSVGIDHRLSPDAIVGLFGGYAHADASFDTDADGSVDTYQVGLYGSWASGGLHVDGMVSGAWQNYELKGSIDFLGRTAKSDYDGWAFGASAQVGYDIALGSAAVIEPMAGLDYIHLETDGFSEDGADSVDLNVESGAFDSLKSSLGVRITAQIDAGDGMVLVPTASVAWEHEFLDAEGEFTASFDGSPNGTNFDIVGSDDEADAAVISLGVALTSDNMTAFVGYDGKINGDSSTHQGTIGIRFGF